MIERGLSPLSANLDAVGNRHQHRLDPLILGKFLIEGIDGTAGRFLDGRANDFARPEHVVEEDQSVLPDAGQEELVIRFVLRLVGIDENEIEGQAGFELAQALNADWPWSNTYERCRSILYSGPGR